MGKVQYEHRASVQLNRMDVINAVVDAIPQVRPEDVQAYLNVALLRAFAGIPCA